MMAMSDVTWEPVEDDFEDEIVHPNGHSTLSMSGDALVMKVYEDDTGFDGTMFYDLAGKYRLCRAVPAKPAVVMTQLQASALQAVLDYLDNDYDDAHVGEYVIMLRAMLAEMEANSESA